MAQPTGKNNHKLQIISILKSSVLSFENVKRPDIPTKCIYLCAFFLRILSLFFEDNAILCNPVDMLNKLETMEIRNMVKTIRQK